MLNLLWLVPAIPYFSFTILAVFGKRMPRSVSGLLGVGSVGISAVISVLIGIQFMSSPPAEGFFLQKLWTWIGVGNFQPEIAFHLDALSLLMMLVVTIVGFLIHLYSWEFMEEDEGFSRFFAYMNLFIGSMLTLVLANNLVLLYLGWEGVGLCSYLLIGFWYKDPYNGAAARKAFITTRIGDTALAIGLFLLFWNLGSLNIQDILNGASMQWQTGSGIALAVALLILAGAVGKSAQLPLQVWLPDAMAGPSPVSALIHAATMVTAGVYLIARTHTIFDLAPIAQTVVAIVGAATLLIAGFSALKQHDIKRVLAYSTISQIGYMFLALGVGAYSAAMFHFMTHAFFKALLFLGAGALIMCLHHEHNMFKMGGMRKQMPLTFWTFLIGSSALAAVPLITAGFYSKDLILWRAWTSDFGSPLLWLAGIIGAFITAIYTFRMVFVTFFGESRMQADKKPGGRISLPLVVLAILALIGGFIEMPHTLGHFAPFSKFMHSVLPEVHAEHFSISTELLFQIIAVVITLGGIFIAYIFYYRKPELSGNIARSGFGSVVGKFFYSGWGFDWLYYTFLVGPFVWIARINKNDIIDFIYTIVAMICQICNFVFRQTQNGRVRSYAAGIAFGAIVIIAIVMFT
ncbi:MAG: NADH-quinone oxidoreductase subunit L [candidate division Zixibacteria bacterium]|nr:NADH-quinone oxidoreductase subunit L [Gammaproteobacteria bacterium]NIR63134.1 NADH-quinone oxidoreductase subunit L [candidate division Zixibacteria bacterium]NIS16275.1 NADH-quinone oxidoreductase subunit L [candidate division Zixibacteria bacterium]NIS45552.1 NADH-quinone oxidoreductase subunit L [candidate division Zixibacteria bacterium]NIU13279.1 NADH-quinone oxidoreductase subunit L [candidate division Zixibacteria bacterium]